MELLFKQKMRNGTPATAKYTPTVTPVTPTSEDVESTGKQGKNKNKHLSSLKVTQ